MTTPESRYDIVLESVPDDLSRQQVRDLLISDLGMAQGPASELLVALPAVVLSDVDELEAVRAKQKLVWCGAEVSMKPVEASGPKAAPTHERAAAPAPPPPAPARPADEATDVPTIRRPAAPVRPEVRAHPQAAEPARPSPGGPEGPAEAGAAPPREPRPQSHDGELPSDARPRPDAVPTASDMPAPPRPRPLAGHELPRTQEPERQRPAPPPTPPRTPSHEERPRPDEGASMADDRAFRVPPRTQMGIASPAEERVERLRKTLGAARRGGNAPAITPDAPTSTKYARSIHPYVMLCLGLLALVFLAMYFVRPSEEDRLASGQDAAQLKLYQQWYAEGTQKELAGHYQEAGVAFEAALKHAQKREAQDALARVRWKLQLAAAKEAEREGRLQEALQAYQTAEAQMPSPDARGGITRVTKRLAERQTAQANAASVQLLKDDAVQLERRQDWQGLVGALEELRATQGDSPELQKRIELAKLRARQAEFASQEVRLRESQEAKAAAWIERARRLLANGMTNQAAQTARRALLLSPNNSAALDIVEKCTGSRPRPTQPTAAKTTQGAGAAAGLPTRLGQARPKAAVAPATAQPRPRAKPEARPTPKAKPRYFWPRAAGDTWEYRSPIDRRARTTHRVVGPALYKSIACVAYKVTQVGRARRPTTTIRLSERKDGLYEVPNSGDTVKRYQLPLRLGQSFSYEVGGHVTQEVVTQPAKVDVTTEREETVKTPAGTFNCFVVSRVRQQKRFLKKTAEITQALQERTEWVCPGVGLVKMEQVETVKVMGRKDPAKVVREALELISYKRR